MTGSRVGADDQTLSAHAGPLTALDMNEPYGMLVTAGQDDTVKVWDLCDGEQLGQLRGHKGKSAGNLILSY